MSVDKTYSLQSPLDTEHIKRDTLSLLVRPQGKYIHSTRPNMPTASRCSRFDSTFRSFVGALLHLVESDALFADIQQHNWSSSRYSLAYLNS